MGYASFHQLAPKIGYHSNVPSVITKRKVALHICIYAEDLVKISVVYCEVIGF